MKIALHAPLSSSLYFNKYRYRTVLYTRQICVNCLLYLSHQLAVGWAQGDNPAILWVSPLLVSQKYITFFNVTRTRLKSKAKVPYAAEFNLQV
jgi:hypothetical protein